MRKPLIDKDCVSKLEAEHLNYFIRKQVESVGLYGDLLATLESEKDNKNACLVVDSKLNSL